ncbi:MAG TPA: arginase family protein [Acidimicrobiales bacterium]|nr:arginase family protein [Acidimicrobiales bacterium]
MAPHDPGARAPRLDVPFVGIPSFLRSKVIGPDEDFVAAVAVLGAPTDEGSPFMPGSRFGPRALREHSLRFVSSEPGYFDPNRGRAYLQREMGQGLIVDLGDADIIATNIESSFDSITALTARALRSGALPVVLGGDHAISYPVVRAYENDLYVVHFDAHLDYMPFVHGTAFTNQHAFRHIAKLPHVRGLAQVGIRSTRNTQRMWRDTLGDGNHVVTMSEFRRRGAEDVARFVPEGANCYVSLDMDVLDMALVPGCVSAEPEGMSYAELLGTLIALTERARTVGFDLVEVNPMLDVGTGVTAYLGAHTIIEFLGHICASKWWGTAADDVSNTPGA